MNAPDPKANTTTEAYLAYKAGYLEESELKPVLYKPDWHFDGWLAYWAGLVNTYPTKENGDPEMLCDEEALVAYLSGVTDTYPEEIKDPYDVRIVGYLRHLASIRWPEPDYPVNNEEFYLSTMEPTHTSNPVPSSDIELDTAEGKIISVEAYGDTYQQAYSGANLFDYTDTQSVSVSGVTVDDEGWITLKKDNTLGGSTSYINYFSKPMQLAPDTDYAIIIEVKRVEFSTVDNSGYLSLTTGNALDQWKYTFNYTLNTLQANSVYVAVQRTKSDLSSASIGLRMFLATSAGASNSITFRASVLADTSITPETFVYQPYTGGIPAPNPDYPQPIQTVTGEQTVRLNGENLFDKNNINKMNAYFDSTGLTITSDAYNRVFYVPCEPNTNYHFVQGNSSLSNHLFQVATTSELPAIGVHVSNFVSSSSSGPADYLTTSDAKYLVMRIRSGDDTTTFWDGVSISKSQSFTVDLGSIELCKIGDYQDYIYKSGDDWYVHKVIKKMIFDGSSDENWDNLQNTKLFRIRVTDLIGQDDGTVLGPILSNYYISTAYNDLSSPQSTMDYGVALRATSANGVGIKNIDVADVAGFKTWLSNNNTIVYAPLATATDTKITDATLVGQLEALAGADTYDGKTFIKVTTSDPNLPALLKVEAYKY